MSAFNPRPPSHLPNPVWLTRDRTCGALVAEVEVWGRQPPSRYQLQDGDVLWLAEPLDAQYPQPSASSHLGTWTLSEACDRVGFAVPTTDVECVRFPPRRSVRAEGTLSRMLS